ncbi:MAG: DNA-directed RNA polymerase subunit D [Nanoarchaeota archaeon]
MVEFTQKNNKAFITFEKGYNTIVNSIRRIILEEVPTIAIEEVEVIKNESPLYDETIAQRLGLIPLTTDIQSYNFKSQCSCGGVGCAMCEVKMSLKQNEPGFVYSCSIKSDDPQIVPVDNEIPITKLFKNHQLDLNLRAILGQGKEHAKWSPAHSYLQETDDKLELIIEPFGQLEPKVIYNKAIEIIIDKITKLEEQL